MKTLILITLLILTGSKSVFSQNDSLIINCEKISRSDQAIAKYTDFDMDVYEAIFQVNFKKINAIISKNQLANYQTKFTRKQKKTIERAFLITYTHMLVYLPEMILNPTYIAFMKNAINENKMDRQLLIFPLTNFYYNNSGEAFKPMCPNLDLAFQSALDAWGIDKKELLYHPK